MATPPEERFGGAVSRVLPSSNTRGTGGPAPANSGQQSAIRAATIQNRQDFGVDNLDLGFESPAERQARIISQLSQDKPKNILDKTILAGNKWGVVDLGGVKFVNPLKTMFSGLDFVNEEVANPIAGYAVGNAATSLAMITNWSSAHEISRRFQAKMDGVSGGFWETRTALKEFNEEREALFWGEKFITSIAADPTTYLGFGWFMKTPKLFALAKLDGKSVPVLGAVERGWIQAWNMPFEVGANALKGKALFRTPDYLPVLGGKSARLPGVLGQGIPLSGSQKAALHGQKVFDQASDFMREASGGKNIETITKADVQGALAQVLDVSVPYNSLTPNGRVMRDTLLENPRLTGKAASDLIQQVGGGATVARFGKVAGRTENPAVKEVIQYLQTQSADIADDVGIRLAMSETRDLYVSGRISLGEATVQLQKLTGAAKNEITQRQFETTLKGWARDTHMRAQALINDDHPRGIIEQVRARAVNTFKKDSEHLFHERMQRMAWPGTAITRLDNIQKSAFVKGLQKWTIATPAKLILTFPTFPIQERMESMIRRGLGQGGLSLAKRDVASYNKIVAGNFNVPSSLAREGKNIAGQRSATNRLSALADPDQPFGEIEIAEKGARWLLGNRNVNRVSEFVNDKKYAKSLKWLNPDHWNRTANDWSAGGRRAFHEQAAIKEAQALYANDPIFRDMADYLNSNLSRLPKEVRDELGNRLALAGASGNGEAVRAVAEDYTGRVIQDIDIDNLVEGRFGANDLHPSSRDLVETWKQQGARDVSVDRLVRQIEDNEYDLFVQGLGGFEVQLDLSIGQIDEAHGLLTSIPLAERRAEDVLMAEEAIKGALQSIDGVDRRISDILSRATKRTREIAFVSTKKEEIQKQAAQQVNSVVNRLLQRKSEYLDSIKRLEMEALQGRPTGLTGLAEQKFDTLIDGWRLDRRQVSEHFEAWKDKPKTEGFWQELGEIRDSIQTTMRDRMYDLDGQIHNIQTRELRRRGVDLPDPDFNQISKKIQAKETYSVDDLAEMVGQNAENVTQAMMQAIWLNKDDFTNYFMKRAAHNGVKGVDAAKVGDVYKRIQKAFALDDKIGNHFANTKHNLRQFGSELKAAAKAPRFRPEQEDATKGVIEGFAQLIDNKPQDVRRVIHSKGQEGVDRATDQLNRAFVNYDGQNGIDDFMKNLMPFWTYESRRLPFLLRSAVTNPVVWNTFGPEGNYWSATDDGYVNPGLAPWMDINIFGGTMLNAPRRMKKGDMPPEHEGGIRGAISGAEQQLAQGGFYFGPHMTFSFDAIIGGDLPEAAGGAAPPPLSGTLSMAAWSMADVPVVGESLKKMRTSVLPDKFRTYETAKILWESGVNPAYVDFDKWEPRPGRESLVSQDQINEALRQSALVEWIKEMTGMVRYRGDHEKTYRAERDRIQMEWTGLTKAELDEAKRQGISLTEITPMPPKVAQLLQELDGSEQFGASVAILSSGEKARLQELSREMWETYDGLKVEADAEQAADDAAWANGEMGASVWRERMSQRKQAIGGFIDQMRGFKRDPKTGEKIQLEGEFRYREVPTTFEEYSELQKKLGNDTIRIQHPTSQALEMYHSIAPVDRDGDGVPEWNEFFEAREAVLAQAPPELRRDMLEKIEASQTEAEKLLGRMQRGILGDYWRVDDEVKDILGVGDLVDTIKLEERRDPERAALLRALPAMRAYRNEVQRRKDLLRLQSPELDYALNIFGFTGNTLRFKNPLARTWWEKGNGVQKKVPWMGYLDGFDPPAAGETE